LSQSFNAEQSRATTRIVPSGSESSPDSDFAFLVRKKVSDIAWGCAIAACRAGRWFSGCPQCYPVRMSRAIELLGAVRERRQLQRQEPRTGGHDHAVRCRPCRALVFDSASSLGWRPGLYAAVPPGLTTCWVRRYPASERRRMPLSRTRRCAGRTTHLLQVERSQRRPRTRGMSTEDQLRQFGADDRFIPARLITPWVRKMEPRQRPSWSWTGVPGAFYR
jgi:hypothetical protein